MEHVYMTSQDYIHMSVENCIDTINKYNFFIVIKVNPFGTYEEVVIIDFTVLRFLIDQLNSFDLNFIMDKYIKSLDEDDYITERAMRLYKRQCMSLKDPKEILSFVGFEIRTGPKTNCFGLDISIKYQKIIQEYPFYIRFHSRPMRHIKNNKEYKPEPQPQLILEPKVKLETKTETESEIQKSSCLGTCCLLIQCIFCVFLFMVVMVEHNKNLPEHIFFGLT